MLGGYEKSKDGGKEAYLGTAMTLTMNKKRPVVADSLKFLKIPRAGAATVFYGGKPRLCDHLPPILCT